jgi:hypothetical protein
VDIQETVLQETVKQDTELSNHFESQTQKFNAFPTFEISKKRLENLKNSGEQPQTQAEPDNQAPAVPQGLTPSKNGPTTVGDIITTRRKTGSRRPKTGSDQALPSRAGASAQKSRGRAPKAPERIAYLIRDFSAEFHDSEATDSNLGQAARLYSASGFSEAEFCQLMYEARAITKDRVITKPAKGEAGEWGARNRMPYFFKVLIDLLGMKETAPAEAPTAAIRAEQVNEEEKSSYEPPPNYRASFARLKAQARKLSTRTP